MIKNIKKTTTPAIIAGFLIICFTACEKKEEKIIIAEKPVQVATTIEKQDIIILKSYLSELTNAKLDNIEYNEASMQFSIYGVNQISLEKLTKFYNQSKNK